MQQSPRGIVGLLTTRYPDKGGQRLAESAPIDPGVIPTDDAVRASRLTHSWTADTRGARHGPIPHASCDHSGQASEQVVGL